MSSYERGLALEELVAKIFRAKGYDVKHNVKLIGRSGVEHQIDVYAEYKAPLHTSRIVIECKSYDKPIDKDIVMKLIHEVEDLGVDRGILVTTSYFTPDAISTASGYNIDLWDGAKLREALKELGAEIGEIISNIFYVEPQVSIDESAEVVDKTLRGIFGRRGIIESISVVFYPYYELDIDARIYEIKGIVRRKAEERIISTTVLMDPITEALCYYDLKEGIIAITTIPTLSEEEQTVFRMLLQAGSLTAPAVAALIGCSTAKARRILQGLVAKGLVNLYRNRQTRYETAIKIPEPYRLGTISMALMLNEGEPSKGIKLQSAFSLERAETIIKTLWRGTIKDYKTIFYPYCACKITEGEKRYIKAVDLINGKIDNRISQILTTYYEQPPFLKQTKNLSTILHEQPIP